MNFKNILKSISAAALLSVSAAAIADSDKSMPQAQSANVSTAISDTAITAKVKAKYMNDTRLKETDISVTTVNGVVTLTGSVPTLGAKGVAGDLAKGVEGVSSVDNDIQMPSVANKAEKSTKNAAKTAERKVSDSWITTKVKSALLADSVTKGFKIHVKTRHHIVALSGTVDAQTSIAHAAELASQIKGVASVDTAALKTTSN